MNFPSSSRLLWPTTAALEPWLGVKNRVTPSHVVAHLVFTIRQAFFKCLEMTVSGSSLARNVKHRAHTLLPTTHTEPRQNEHPNWLQHERFIPPVPNSKTGLGICLLLLSLSQNRGPPTRWLASCRFPTKTNQMWCPQSRDTLFCGSVGPPIFLPTPP